MDFAGGAQAALGAILLAYLPGRAWVPILLPRLRTRIERFAFAVGLSVAMLVAAVYLGNVVFGIPVSGAHAAWMALALALAGFAAQLRALIRAALENVLRARPEP